MSGSRDVDDLWQKLKAQSGPAQRRTLPGGSGKGTGGILTGLGGIPGVTRRVQTFDKSATRLPQEAARPSFIAQLGEAPREQQQQQSAELNQALLVSPPPPPPPPPVDRAGVCRILQPNLRPPPLPVAAAAAPQRDINGLRDTDRGVRRRAVSLAGAGIEARDALHLWGQPRRWSTSPHPLTLQRSDAPFTAD